MSDPITNDYTSVSTLTEAQSRIAVFETVLRDARRGFPRSETRQLLDMLGLTDTAWGIVGRAKPAPLALPGPRDNLGPLRTAQPPVTPIPDGKVCGCCGSDLSEDSPHVYVHPTSGKAKCKVCRQAKERERRANEKRRREAVAPVDPDLCRCSGPKHRLHTSPNGRRYCPVQTLVRQRAMRAKAKEARTGATA